MSRIPAIDTQRKRARIAELEKANAALVAERDALRSALDDAQYWVNQYMDQNDCDIDDDDLDVSICMRKIRAALTGAGHD